MIYRENPNFVAREIQPNPREVSYWIDLTESPLGLIIKTWVSGKWVRINPSDAELGGLDLEEVKQAINNLETNKADKYEVQQVKEEIWADTYTKQLVDDKLDTKEDTLVSGVTIKTINGNSLLGSGDITIEAGEDVDLTDYLTKEEASNTYQPTGHYLTSIPPQYVTETELESKGYALKTDIPSTDLFITEKEASATYQPKGSYLTSVPAEYVTESELSLKGYATTELIPDISTKQDTLVSGTNIKTINNLSILGQGNIEITTGTGGITDAPADGNTYGRKNNQWTLVTIPNTSELATKTELSNKLDTETYNADKATFALKTEIPDTSTFITTETADSKYQPKGTYLTEVPDEYVTDTELTELLALKANANELSNYLTIASATSTYATKTDLDSKLDTSTYTTDKSTFATTTLLASKQDTLVSGTNIKTVNGLTILGEGDILIETPEGGIADAPSDDNTYARKNGTWAAITIPDTSNLATKTELSSYATLTGAQFTGTIGAPMVAVVDNSDGMRAAIQSSNNDILFRTYNAGIDSMTFLVQNSTPLKITEAGIWENNTLLENKYAKLTDLDDLALKAELPSNVSELTNDAGYITNSSLASYATLEYVNTQISNLINSAPEALNTLDELAAALNGDSNFATTVTNQIAAKLDITTYTSDKETFALKTELSSKADSSALANYLTTATAESTYAKKSEIPQLSLLPYDFFGEVEYTNASGGTDTITISGDKYSTYCIGSGTVNVTFGTLIDGVKYHLLVRGNAGTITLGIPDLGAKYEVFVIGNKTLFTIEDDSILEMSFMSYGDLIVCRVSEPSSYTIAYNNTSGGEDSFG